MRGSRLHCCCRQGAEAILKGKQGGCLVQVRSRRPLCRDNSKVFSVVCKVLVFRAVFERNAALNSSIKPLYPLTILPHRDGAVVVRSLGLSNFRISAKGMELGVRPSRGHSAHIDLLERHTAYQSTTQVSVSERLSTSLPELEQEEVRQTLQAAQLQFKAHSSLITQEHIARRLRKQHPLRLQSRAHL